ncbi:MAG TPA: hypothetical protein VK088_06170 [Acidimicrobiia bacterium]|nr:hypothetical protein [Acidimicrobiia bacterium]
MTALIVLEGVVIALLVVLVAGLLRSHAEILRRLEALDGGTESANERAEGLQVARRAPKVAPEAITGTTPAGSATSIATRNSRGFVLVAFLSSGCSTCRPFWEALGAGAEMPAPDVRPVIVTKDATEESPGRIAELAPRTVPTIMSSAAWDEFKIPVSPYFVLVDAETGDVVGEGAAASWDHVRDLMVAAMADAGYGRAKLDTVARSLRTEAQLDAAGIKPGDPSLYRNPHGDDS